MKISNKNFKKKREENKYEEGDEICLHPIQCPERHPSMRVSTFHGDIIAT